MSKFHDLLDAIVKAKTQREYDAAWVDLELYLELDSYSMKSNKNGKIQIESVDDIKRRIDRHIDEFGV